MGEQSDTRMRLLGLRLGEARKAKHLTRESLAAQCDITAVHLRHIEDGSRLPSLPVFVSLCNALSVNPAYVLGDYINAGTELPNDYNRAVNLLMKAPPHVANLIVSMLETMDCVIADWPQGINKNK